MANKVNKNFKYYANKFTYFDKNKGERVISDDIKVVFVSELNTNRFKGDVLSIVMKDGRSFDAYLTTKRKKTEGKEE